jgi:hypothetical protein
MTKAFPVQQVLELACAAQRINGAYIKETEWVYDSEGAPAFRKEPNKFLMLFTLGLQPHPHPDPMMSVGMLLKTTKEDTALAEAIKTHFRKLMFSAVKGDNEFQTEVNTLLHSEEIKMNQFGYIACLPSVYERDVAQTKVKKAASAVEEGYLAEIGSALKDLDSEIISSVKSKNFEGYNIDAIINNRMASWLNKTDLKMGPAVIVKAKVKDHSKHWKHGNDVTRLNYVKAVQ